MTEIPPQVAEPVPASEAPPTTFRWHPQYQGRDVASVRREVTDEIRRDQRAYELALDGAEQNEQSSLQAIMKLDSRWCSYDFGWTEADPAQLGERVMAIELERERRQEMVPVGELRGIFTPVETARGVRVDEESISRGLGIPRWVYLAVTLLIVVSLIVALLAGLF